MSSLDTIQALKQRRRAEIAEEKRQREEAEAARDRESESRLDAAVRAALDQEGAASLYEYRVPHADPFDRTRRSYHIEFLAPGHRAIQMLVVRVEQARGEWLAATGTAADGVGGRWSATARNEYGEHYVSCDCLADALIAAEIEGLPPPQRDISEEASYAAARAWEAMLHDTHPMPPEIALDLAQNETGGDRALAAEAIHFAAGVWLDVLRPELPSEYQTSSFNASVSVRGHLLGASYSLAEGRLTELIDIANGIRASVREGEQLYTQADVNLQMYWLEWAKRADRAIGLCREVTAATFNHERAA